MLFRGSEVKSRDFISQGYIFKNEGSQTSLRMLFLILFCSYSSWDILKHQSCKAHLSFYLSWHIIQKLSSEWRGKVELVWMRGNTKLCLIFAVKLSYEIWGETQFCIPWCYCYYCSKWLVKSSTGESSQLSISPRCSPYHFVINCEASVPASWSPAYSIMWSYMLRFDRSSFITEWRRL